MESQHQQHYSSSSSSSSSSEGEEEDRGRQKTLRSSTKWVMMGRVLIDPRAKWVQEWNRAFLLVCATGLFLDPLFFYAVSISEACMCLFVDGWFAVTVTVLRCMTDALHVWNMWLQFKMVTVERIIHCSSDDEDDECGEKEVARRYLKSKKGFLLDLFVILPVPQAAGACWYLLGLQRATKCLKEQCRATQGCMPRSTLACEQIMYYGSNNSRDRSRLIWAENRHVRFMCIDSADNFVYGAYRWTVPLVTNENRLEKVLFPIFWGLMTLRLVESLTRLVGRDSCAADAGKWKLDAWTVAGKGAALQGHLSTIGAWTAGVWRMLTRDKWTSRRVTRGIKRSFPDASLSCWLPPTQLCWAYVEANPQYIWKPREYNRMAGGGFQHRNPHHRIDFGHYVDWKYQGVLECNHIKETSNATKDEELGMVDEAEALACEFQAESASVRKAALGRDTWRRRVRDDAEPPREPQKRHQIPSLFRSSATGAPFQHMDDLVLENICDRVKSLIFPKGEVITREGDPVQRMLFVVRGHLQSSQVLRDGVESQCMLGPGNFSGDELLSWCLRRPFIERLPPSSFTLLTLETTEAFGLEAEDVKYVTQHFRYTFVNEKVKRSARYYSPGWRTWAAVAIQLSWRRYRHRLTLTSLSFIRPRRPLSRSSSLGEDRLRLYTALLTSPKPEQGDLAF
ncbi:hypothetical protein Syun_027225 [Stephania yunnanensis]|uniref:Cyclic nucleotide-binding domain-containing protein n=1 Tax=Stephania yunnanensis TaxID=152371 RepID=A0AAP0EFK3_9MAGN